MWQTLETLEQCKHSLVNTGWCQHWLVNTAGLNTAARTLEETVNDILSSVTKYFGLALHGIPVFICRPGLNSRMHEALEWT